jgi:hypothetical protein
LAERHHASCFLLCSTRCPAPLQCTAWAGFLHTPPIIVRRRPFGPACLPAALFWRAPASPLRRAGRLASYACRYAMYASRRIDLRLGRAAYGPLEEDGRRSFGGMDAGRAVVADYAAPPVTGDAQHPRHLCRRSIAPAIDAYAVYGLTPGSDRPNRLSITHRPMVGHVAEGRQACTVAPGDLEPPDAPCACPRRCRGCVCAPTQGRHGQRHAQLRVTLLPTVRGAQHPIVGGRLVGEHLHAPDCALQQSVKGQRWRTRTTGTFEARAAATIAALRSRSTSKVSEK